MADEQSYAVPSADILSAMAKSGVKVEGDSPGNIPDIKIEAPIQEAPPAPTPEKVETTTPVIAKEEPKVEVTPPPAQQAAPKVETQVDWKQNLKTADVAEVLKEIGFDEKQVGFFLKWKNEGDIKEYLEAVTVDYSKMPAEELMKRQLLQEYKELSPEDFEELYRMKVIEQYKLDPELNTEKEIQRGKILLNADAKRVRDQFIQKQQEYILSKPPQSNVELQQQQLEQERQQNLERYTNAITNDPFTKELLASKKLKIGQGEEAFNYEVANPEKYLSALKDPTEWVKLVFNEDGTPNARKQILISAIAHDDESILLEYGKHLKSLGAKQIIEPIENAKAKVGTPSKADAQPQSPAEWLAKHGKVTSG